MYVPVWMVEEWIWGTTYSCICVAGSLCCPPKTTTTFLIDYTPIQNKKLKKREKKHVSIQKRKRKKERNQTWFSSFSLFAPIPPSSPPAPFCFSFLPFLSPTFFLFFSPCHHFPIQSLPHLHTYDSSSNFGLLSNPDASEQKQKKKSNI